jgi:hypothetical protein
VLNARHKVLKKIERVRIVSAAWREITPEKKRQPRLALRKLKYSQLVHFVTRHRKLAKIQV